jgi:hypothetical protein
LEDSKNCRSSRGHGNQHVRVRGSQIGLCSSFAFGGGGRHGRLAKIAGKPRRPPPKRLRLSTRRNRYREIG